MLAALGGALWSTKSYPGQLKKQGKGVHDPLHSFIRTRRFARCFICVLLFHLSLKMPSKRYLLATPR